MRTTSGHFIRKIIIGQVLPRANLSEADGGGGGGVAPDDDSKKSKGFF